MNASFAHFIFIRFSVPIGYIKEGITIDETWLKYRWEIFNRITLPSLKNQTNQNFRILIFFDKRSPQWLIDENEKTAKGYSKYIPFYVESSEDLKNQSNIFLQSLYDKEGWTHLIASRIDSDDAYHKDAVTAIQKQFAAQDDYIFVFSKLLCFRDKPKELISQYYYPSSPFVSMIAKAQTPLNFELFKNHTKLKNTFKLKKFPYALQYIHGSNVSNEMRGVAATNINLRDYGIDFDIARSYFSMLAESLKAIGKKNLIKLKKSVKKRIL